MMNARAPWGGRSMRLIITGSEAPRPRKWLSPRRHGQSAHGDRENQRERSKAIAASDHPEKIASTQAHSALKACCVANGRTVGAYSLEIYGDWSNDPRAIETTIQYLLR